jgi:hypothetical protein
MQRNRQRTRVKKVKVPKITTIILEVVIDGNSSMIEMEQKQKIIGRLHEYEELCGKRFLYDSWAIQPKDTPFKLNMQNGARIIVKDIATCEEELCGHLRSERFDVSKFMILPVPGGDEGDVYATASFSL